MEKKNWFRYKEKKRKKKGVALKMPHTKNFPPKNNKKCTVENLLYFLSTV